MMRMALAVAVLAGVAALPLPASAQNDGRMRIVGHATVEVAPDFVMVRVGVSTKAPSPTAALDQNSAVARKIIDFAKTFGVEAARRPDRRGHPLTGDEVGTRPERKFPAGAGRLLRQQYRPGQAVRSVAPRHVHAPGA